jgi:hypothetical protein
MRLGKIIFTICGTLKLRDDGDPCNAPQLLDEEATTFPEETQFMRLSDIQLVPIPQPISKTNCVST